MLSGSPVFANETQQALNAINRGDYKTAIDIWQNLANRGNNAAQFNLGLIGNAVHEYQATYISSWQLIRCFIRKMQGHGMSSTSENK